MIFKNIKQEFDYILWLRERINKLNFGITRRVKTDSTNDFELLARKLNTYRQEYEFVLNELYSLLKNDGLSTETNNLREESGALPIRSSYSDWEKKKDEAELQAAKQRRNNCRSKIQRRLSL
jgi:hypothetical protein